MLADGTYLADRYEVINKIGAGGMSDVYKAKDHILGRFVAIKVLKNEFSDDRGFVTKFRTEAQSAAGLEHPNIVNIYDVGSEEGLYYIVMEYIEGITLKTYIEKKGQLSFKESASIAIQIARGIEAAHNKKITHRDIKPQNIIISTDGKVKVTDFGIAKAASSNTISSDVMGSVHYSSPEQARNGFVDGRSDIYSLGIVMYEMVTGRVPFDGETTVSVAIQHLQEEMVPPSTYAKNLPISMEKIILKCTQKNPDRRYQTIADLLKDLRNSLVNPDEDFVNIAPVVDNGKTKVISNEELKQIKERGVAETPEPVEVTPEPVISTYTEPEEISNEEELYEEEEEEGLSPKLDKAVTIMGIVVAALLLIVIIYLVGTMFNWFRMGEKDKNTESQQTQTESQIETESESESESEKASESQDVVMINITDHSKEEAEQMLNDLGLYMFVIATQKSDKPAGTIIDQDIHQGTTVPKGSTIKVIVAGEENQDYDEENGEKITIQSVLGKMEAEASRILTGQGLPTPTRTYQYSDTVEAGKVISQDPAAGSEVDATTKVTLVISQGKQSVQVPKVIGGSKDNAVKALEAAGLQASVSEAYSDSVAEGLVISQSISNGKTVEAGTTVSITVSLGAESFTYSFNQSYSDDAAIAAEYSLVGSDGVTYTSGNVDGDSVSVSASDIGCESGTVTITWTLETVGDGDEIDTMTRTDTHSVTFEKQ